jgi:phage terminase large subunit-like protein
MADSLALQPESVRATILSGLTERQLFDLQYDWSFWGRPEQRLPEGSEWLTWLLLAGRGFGKTRTGAEAVRALVCGKTPLLGTGYGRIAIVAETAADARESWSRVRQVSCQFIRLASGRSMSRPSAV